ncbi:unnamed protein product [Caenorhabditis sp. 36 PRJEB53466]|nr:unnamed protein product [Caenorhabditis sp. 36 PRJEB53466]
MLPQCRWPLLVVLLVVVAAESVEDASFIDSFKTMFFGNEPQRAPNDTATLNNPPISYHQYSASATSSRSQPPSGQSCTLPRQIGTGPYRIPRWYYNPVRGRCELFYWSGCCGNGNNFQTFQTCQSTCEASSSSSVPSSPSLSPSSSSSQIVFSTPQLSVFQPSSTQIDVLFQPNLLLNNHYLSMPPVLCPCCLRPYSEGYGGQNLLRFYYDAPSKSCRQFIYRGLGGYGNQFETEAKCRNSCAVTDSGGPQTLATPPPTRFVTSSSSLPTTSTSTSLPPVVYVSTVDPCSQDKEPGVGAVQLPRFFFNKETRICEQFTYFGSGGNRNNFQTLEECQAQCPETPNPCAGCGTGSYCHVGAQSQTTVCCPKPAAVDRCQQPLNIGIGNSNLQRWYFNPLTQQCQSCTYRGLQGNENNFLSQNECEQSCLVNPCKIGSPYRSQGITVQCSASSPTTTSVCCQALGNSPCEEEMTQGEGTAALTRFYYDATQRKCLAFNYLGLKGNRNNFQSKEHCESTCPVWINPCAIGQPIMSVEQRPFQCHQGAPCSTGYFCHLGFDDATTVCCQSEGDPCSLVVKEGHGNHHLSRWFYNQKTRQCQPFTYTGTAGNENNFLLREHCEATCPVWINACPSGEPYLLPNGKPQPCESDNTNSCPLTHWCHPGPDASTTMCCPGRVDPCTQTLAQGEGPLSVTRFYFNAQSRTCDEFMFRGLKGNANNFKSLAECERLCPVQQNPCPITMSSLKHSAKLAPCSATKSCPSQQWCHYGETKETTVCCPNGQSTRFIFREKSDMI